MQKNRGQAAASAQSSKEFAKQQTAEHLITAHSLSRLQRGSLLQSKPREVLSKKLAVQGSLPYCTKRALPYLCTPTSPFYLSWRLLCALFSAETAFLQKMQKPRTSRGFCKNKRKGKKKRRLKHCIFIIICICEEKKWLNFKFVLSCIKNIKSISAPLLGSLYKKGKPLYNN